jgi:ribosomal protein S6--L-glutamate ligase
MKIGVIGTTGGWSSELLADTVAERTGFRLLVDMDHVVLDLEHGTLRHGDMDLAGFDGLIVKKIGHRYSPDLLDRLEMLRFLEAKGVRIFSSPMAIMRVLDRLSCTVTLRAQNIPMPPTVITESVKLAMETVERYGEAVFKPLYSSKARGMKVVVAGPGAKEEIEDYKAVNVVMYIQKKIDLGSQDLGVVFLGGEYLTTYARCKNGDSWNTTIASGGRYAPHIPSRQVFDLAKRAQAPFGLDFTCVDVVETASGSVVFEVSAFGGFRGIKATGDIDPAARYVDYVLARLK